MHTRELIELGAVVAVHAPVLTGHTHYVSEGGVERYWSASKCRLDRWSRMLKNYVHDIQSAGAVQLELSGGMIRPVFEEILTGELLARVWAAAACAYDRRRGLEEVGPGVRSVLMGHLQARRRALNLMVYGRGFGLKETVALNQLRRRTERWTDLLLGSLLPEHDVAEFACDPQRAREFAGDLNPRARPLLLLSLREAFQDVLSTASPNGDLNGQIASSVLSCLPPDLLDATGPLRSLWLLRLEQGTGDLQRMAARLT